MNKNNNNKTMVIALLGLLLVAAIVVFFVFFKNKDKPKEDDIFDSPSEMLSESIVYNEDGTIKLVDLKNGETKDEFDLKTLSTPRIETITETVIKSKTDETIEQVKVEKEDQEVFKGFGVVERTIIKGENAWTIQESLTPERSINEMWLLLKELNNYSMHPIYPGESWLFLVELEEEYEEVVVEVENSYEEEVTREVEIKEEDYIYYESAQENKLFAHSDVDKTVYEIVANDGKLRVNKVIAHEDIGEPTKFVTDGQKALFAFDNDRKVYVLNDNKLKEVHLHHVPENLILTYDVEERGVFYTSGEYMGYYDFNEDEATQALLGANVKNVFYQFGMIHILTDFGKGLEKSLYYHITPQTLLVNEAMEISSDISTMFTSLDETALRFSLTEKTGAKNTAQIKDDKTLSLDLKSLKEIQHGSWKMPYQENGVSNGDYIYVRTDNGLDVYQLQKEEVVKQIKIVGEKVMLVNQ